MRKNTFLLGAGMGFILGSRIGRGPYEQLEGVVVKVMHRPDERAPSIRGLVRTSRRQPIRE